jgi:alpha-tubulin suppressor-like RCC1 family protein
LGGLVLIAMLAFQNCSPGFSALDFPLASLTGGTGGDGASQFPADIPADIVADPNAALSVYVRNTEARQGGDLVFKIELNKVTDTPVVVQLVTIADTAVAGSDFDLETPTATIPAGDLSVLVTIPARVVQILTVDRRMKLKAISASKGLIAQAEGVGLIRATQKSISLKTISSDFIYSCGLTAEGKVICWGGVRGVATPSEVAGVIGAKQVSTGGYDTCVVTADDKVQCWRGSLGPAERVPADVAGLTGVTQVAVGFAHACALLKDSTVKCWGRNSSGQLGNNDTVNSTDIVSVLGLTGVKQLAIGASHSCAVLNTGKVNCWGDNVSGQLGLGTKVQSLVPAEVPGILNAKIMFAGNSSNCVITNDDKIKCWGMNSAGNLGLGNKDEVLSPVENPNLSGMKQFAFGSSNSCGLTADDKVKCWGSNNQAQLSDLNADESLLPVEIKGLTGIRQITSNCAVTTGDNVKCWGYNVFGQLGDSSVNRPLIPIEDVGLGVVKQIATYSGFQACALTATGGVKCWTIGWGRLMSGELGNGSTRSSFVPVDVVGLAGAKQIAVGYLHSCAITSDDKVKCWGENEGVHLLGDGTNTNSTTPVEVADIVGAKQISSNGPHTCAVLATGKIRCWGFNNEGQLGEGDFGASPDRPVEVVGISDAVQAATGSYFTCALLKDGTVKCWGQNESSGQLGNNSVVNSPQPVDVGLAGVKKIVAAANSTCAITSNDKVACWGRNLLVETAYNLPSVPTEVAGFTGVKDISVSYGNLCAVTLAGKTICAGANGSGQLGNGSTSLSLTAVPVEITRMNEATSVIADSNSTYAIMADGHVRKVGVLRQQSSVVVDVTAPTL